MFKELMIRGGLGNQLFIMNYSFAKRKKTTLCWYDSLINLDKKRKLSPFIYKIPLLYSRHCKIFSTIQYIFIVISEKLFSTFGFKIDRYKFCDPDREFVKYLVSSVDTLPNSIVIHMRLGDRSDEIHDLKTYIVEKINFMISNYGCDFVVCTDSPKIVSRYAPSHFFGSISDGSELSDFYLMSSASILYICDSTYSYWAGVVCAELGGCVYYFKEDLERSKLQSILPQSFISL